MSMNSLCQNMVLRPAVQGECLPPAFVQISRPSCEGITVLAIWCLQLHGMTFCNEFIGLLGC